MEMAMASTVTVTDLWRFARPCITDHDSDGWGNGTSGAMGNGTGHGEFARHKGDGGYTKSNDYGDGDDFGDGAGDGCGSGVFL
jgi:hypothetical protein